jgi:hypothetical protein
VLDDLKRACQANDPRPRARPSTPGPGSNRKPWPTWPPLVPLSDALDGLNGALYSETGQHWQGEELWRAIRTIPMAERVQDPVGDSGLPPLYPK